MSWWKPQRGLSNEVEAAKALESFAETLRAMGRAAFDTDEMAASKWAEQCEGWARRVEGLLRSSEQAPAEQRSDWSSLGGYISEQSAAQADQIKNSLIGLRQVVQACGRSVGEELEKSRLEVARLGEVAAGLESALASNDSAALPGAARALLEAVNAVNAERRGRDQGRLQVLGERLRTIKADLSEARDAQTMDGETGLFNRSALERHLERMVDLAPLFANPPCLLLIDLDLPAQARSQNGHGLLWHVSACVVRSFLRKQDFVARAGERRLSVVLVDTVLPNVDMLCDRIEQSVRDLQGVEGVNAVGIGIGASAWAGGENAQQWLRRVDSLVPKPQAGGRRRSVKPPP